MKRFLIIVPTYPGKSYVLDDFVEHLLAAKCPPEWAPDIIWVSNADNSDDLALYRRLCDMGREQGDWWMVTHLAFKPGTVDQKRVTDAYNLGRAIALQFRDSYDAVLLLEQDVLLRGNELIGLFRELRSDRAVTGVTEYERKELPKESLDRLRRDGVHVAPEPPHGVMVFRKLRAGQGLFKEDPYEAPLVIGPKQGHLRVPLQVSRETGPLPDFEAYLKDEMVGLRNREVAKVEVEGSALGCMLLPMDILAEVPFRYDPSSAAFCDLLFSMDLRAAGYRLFCLPDVWPEHRARKKD